MDRFFDRLGDLLRTVLGGGEPATGAGQQRRRPLHTDDPDLAAAWEELEGFLDGDDGAADGAASSASSGADRGAGAGARTEPPFDELRSAYATLGVAFGAPMSEVKRAYKRQMQVHHPDRFGHDPKLQAAATRKAAHLNAAFARIEAATRS